MIMVIGSWVPDISEEDGKQLVRDVIRVGIFNDIILGIIQLQCTTGVLT